MDGILIGHSKTTENLFIFVPGRNMLCPREGRGREKERGKTPFLPPPTPFLLSDALHWQNHCALYLMLKIWALQLHCQWTQKFRLWSTFDSIL